MPSSKFHIVHVVPDPRLHGLHGYRDIIDTLQWGLTALGHEVSVTENEFASDRTNIVFGFQMLSEAQIENLRADTIVYNFEQLAGLPANALKPAYRLAARRLRVGLQRTQSRGVGAVASRQSRRACARGLGADPRADSAERRAGHRCAVLRRAGTRRLALYSQVCQTGASCVFVCGLYGAARDGLIARAKLVLNIDLNDSRRIFEVVRVSYLLANAKAVVATLQPHTLIEPDLRDTVAFVPIDRVASTCVELLANEPARRQLQQRGEQAIRARDIREILNRALG